MQAARVVLVRAGDSSPAAVRKAVAAAVASLKQSNVQKMALLLSLVEPSSDAVCAAVQACAEASYVYTHTKPSAKARALRKVVLGVTQPEAVQAGFVRGQALVVGVEMAKEWANRPANHATPSLLADCARQLGRKPGFKTEALQRRGQDERTGGVGGQGHHV